jgi:hexosaminidase
LNFFPSLLVSIGFFSGAIFVSGAAATPTPPGWSALSPTRLALPAFPLLPVPAQVEPRDGRLPLTDRFRVTAPVPLSPAVSAAIDRLLGAWQNRIGVKLESRIVSSVNGPGLIVEGLPPTGGTSFPTLGEDESYTLEISAQQARLRANTASGVYRGLASLQQLLTHDAAGWSLPAVSIQDHPRFPWRGLLIDVARRWKPVDVIERNLDGMALVKLNVLHLHLTDDQGFRVESKRHPELTSQGSDGHFYTQTEIRRIVAYAAARGIRVVPEFDLPGHATSWLVSHPELSSGPGPYAIERHWGVFDPVMDPTNEGTYVLLKDFFAEMAALFPDPYVHLGGDENNGVQWSANPRIQAFIRAHHLGDNPGLQAYFNQRVGEIFSQLGKRMIGWDEILHPDLPRGDVIESWRGAESLAQAAQQGFAGILATGFYLDLCHPAADYYRSDPLPAGSTLSPAERARILGGEASMWGEWVSPETIDSRLWPSAAAVAERLWSPAEVRDPAELYRRLEIANVRLAEAGLRQHSYLIPAVQRLLGGQPSQADVDTLVRFIDLLEPVQDYNRGKQQPGSDQWTPLSGIADAARPDSAEARHFAQSVAQFLADPSARATRANALRKVLNAYRATAIQIAGPFAAGSPGLAPAVPLSFQLEDAAQIGLAALRELSFRTRSSPTHSPAFQPEAAFARLAADAEPHDAVTLAVIEPIRQLVAAAAAP